MKKTLVIVESPTKAKTISKFLGKGFVVESSFGHIRDLPKSKMGVDTEKGSFEPDYTIPKDKIKQVKKLQELAKKSDSIIFATDGDREGEAISWHLANILDIKPDKAERIVFHEITKSAIKKALENPHKINKKLFEAQQASRILDRLVGYELSPLLWKKVTKGLSAGRVQSIAMRLVVERERERKNFKTEEYWSLEGIFNTPKNKEEEILAKLNSIAGKKINVEAKLNLKNDTFKDSKFIIAFPNSIPENALTKNDYPFIPNAQIDLLIFDNQNASGSTDMIYSMPGEYEYTLIVDGVPQYQLINVNQKIHIAPLETRLQVKNNDRILGLTWLIIAMMIFQIKREFENLITRLRPVLSEVYDKVAGILK